MSVELRGIHRRFGAVAALQDVSLALPQGEFAALLGPSGSGKTTLLRILAGLDFPDAGEVLIGGRDVARVPARERGVGVVFQHYALFRHMTVRENVAFGLRVRPRRTRPPATEIARRVDELLELVGIGALGARYPDQISGGQRQRVALARALAIEPPLLLLDEPFGALDALVRKEVRRWVAGLQKRLGITAILVTHDQEEAMELAGRVAVLHQGGLAQFDAPQTLLDRPATPFVAGFLGGAARLPARVVQGRLVLPGQGAGWPLRHADASAEIFLRPNMARAVSPRPDLPQGVVRHRLVGDGGPPRALVELAEVLLEIETAGTLAAGDACGVAFRRPLLFVDGVAWPWPDQEAMEPLAYRPGVT